MEAQSTDDVIRIETDQQAADIVCNVDLGSRELRDLASNAGVSRERGDTMRQTAERIVAQDPALAARMIENDNMVEMDASAFRERREVGEEEISLEEAKRRVRHRKMRHKLKYIERAVLGLPRYKVEVEWEYGGSVQADPVRLSPGYVPGGTSITIKPEDDVEMHWALKGRAHVILSPHGRCTFFNIKSGSREEQYIGRNTPDPSHQWRVGMKSVEAFYDPDD